MGGGGSESPTQRKDSQRKTSLPFGKEPMPSLSLFLSPVLSRGALASSEAPEDETMDTRAGRAPAATRSAGRVGGSPLPLRAAL